MNNCNVSNSQTQPYSTTQCLTCVQCTYLQSTCLSRIPVSVCVRTFVCVGDGWMAIYVRMIAGCLHGPPFTRYSARTEYTRDYSTWCAHIPAAHTVSAVCPSGCFASFLSALCCACLYAMFSTNKSGFAPKIMRVCDDNVHDQGV